MLWGCSFWCWGNGKLRILKCIFLCYCWRRQQQLLLLFTCALEEGFFLYAQEMLFSFKQPVYHIRAGKPRYSGWHMERWSGKGAYAYSVCDLDQKSNPQGSICFDSLLGLNLKKPSGQSMASCLRFAFSFAYYLLTGSLLERIKPYQLFSEVRGRCRDFSWSFVFLQY